MAYAQSIELAKEEMKYLHSIVRQRTLEAQIVDRAECSFINLRVCQTAQ